MPFLSLSGVKSRIYRFFGAEIGEHVYFAPKAFILVKDFKKMKIGDGVVFGPHVDIQCEELEVGDDATFSWGVYAVGTILKVGRGCYFAPKVYIDLTEPVIIEDDVGIGADYIFTHSIWHPVTEGGPRKFAPVHIKRGAWIPAGVFIMPGVTVGEDATIGARSLVLTDVPSGSLAVGVPAKVIKTAEENKKELTFEEKDRIVQGILDEYAGKIQKNGAEVLGKESIEESFLSFYVESKRKFFLKRHWVILYTSKDLEEQHLNSLLNLCKRLNPILLVSLRRIPEKIIERFDNRAFSNMIWFSVEDKKRKKSWKEEAVSLHDFFRSHYGIRFRFSERNNKISGSGDIV